MKWEAVETGKWEEVEEDSAKWEVVEEEEAPPPVKKPAVVEATSQAEYEGYTVPTITGDPAIDKKLAGITPLPIPGGLGMIGEPRERVYPYEYIPEAAETILGAMKGIATFPLTGLTMAKHLALAKIAGLPLDEALREAVKVGGFLAKGAPPEGPVVETVAKAFELPRRIATKGVEVVEALGKGRAYLGPEGQVLEIQVPEDSRAAFSPETRRWVGDLSRTAFATLLELGVFAAAGLSARGALGGAKRVGRRRARPEVEAEIKPVNVEEALEGADTKGEPAAGAAVDEGLKLIRREVEPEVPGRPAGPAALEAVVERRAVREEVKPPAVRPEVKPPIEEPTPPAEPPIALPTKPAVREVELAPDKPLVFKDPKGKVRSVDASDYREVEERTGISFGYDGIGEASTSPGLRKVRYFGGIPQSSMLESALLWIRSKAPRLWRTADKVQVVPGGIFKGDPAGSFRRDTKTLNITYDPKHTTIRGYVSTIAHELGHAFEERAVVRRGEGVFAEGLGDSVMRRFDREFGVEKPAPPVAPPVEPTITPETLRGKPELYREVLDKREAFPEDTVKAAENIEAYVKTQAIIHDDVRSEWVGRKKTVPEISRKYELTENEVVDILETEGVLGVPKEMTLARVTDRARRGVKKIADMRLPPKESGRLLDEHFDKLENTLADRYRTSYPTEGEKAAVLDYVSNFRDLIDERRGERAPTGVRGERPEDMPGLTVRELREERDVTLGAGVEQALYETFTKRWKKSPRGEELEQTMKREFGTTTDSRDALYMARDGKYIKDFGYRLHGEVDSRFFGREGRVVGSTAREAGLLEIVDMGKEQAFVVRAFSRLSDAQVAELRRVSRTRDSMYLDIYDARGTPRMSYNKETLHRFIADAKPVEGITLPTGIEQQFYEAIAERFSKRMRKKRRAAEPTTREAVERIEKERDYLTYRDLQKIRERAYDKGFNMEDVTELAKEMFEKDSLAKLTLEEAGALGMRLLEADSVPRLEGLRAVRAAKNVSSKTKRRLEKFVRLRDVDELELKNYIDLRTMEGAITEEAITNVIKDIRLVNSVRPSDGKLVFAYLAPVKRILGEKFVGPYRAAELAYLENHMPYVSRVNDVFSGLNHKAREAITAYREGKVPRDRLSPEMRRASDELTALYDDLWETLDMKSYFKEGDLAKVKEYSPRREAGREDMINWAFSKRGMRDFDFWAEHKRTGELWPTELDAKANALAYVRSGFRTRYFREATKAAGYDVNEKGKLIPARSPVTDLSPQRQAFANRWVDTAIRRIPTKDEMVMDAAGRAVIRSYNRFAEKIFKRGGISIKGNERLYRTFVSIMLDLNYSAFMGLRPKLGLRNLTQQWLIVNEYGLGAYMRGRARLHSGEVRAAMDKSTVVRLREKQYAVFEEHLNRFADIPARTRHTLMKLYRLSDRNNVKVAFSTGFSKAKARGLGEKAAVRAGEEAVHNTQWGYGIDLPYFFRTPTGRIAGQYNSWFIWYADHITRMVREKHGAKAARMLIQGTVLYHVAERYGIDYTRTFMFGVVPEAFGYGVQAATDVIKFFKAVGTMSADKIWGATGKVAKTGLGFVPTSLFSKDILEAERRGSLKPLLTYERRRRGRERRARARRGD